MECNTDTVFVSRAAQNMYELGSGKSNWKIDLEIPGEACEYTLSKLGPIARYKPDCLYGSTVTE
jgi:hypothetical protein